MRRFFLVAGEPSGDALGAALMRSLRRRTPGEVEFVGVGGPLMEAEGLVSRFPISDIAVIGVFEILPRLRTLLTRIRETARAAADSGAEALITIDAPGFGLRVAKRAKALRPGLKTIHYVAPSVWAWRPGRAREMAPYTDHVLALLPFEPPYMTEAGMGCDFVGHPIAELLPPDPAEVARFRSGFGPGPLVTVLPGSRRSEVARLGALFGETVARAAETHPGLEVVVPAAGAVAEETAAAVAAWSVPVTLLDPRESGAAAAETRKHLAFAASDAALAASGTVTLELAAMGCPMVAAYRMNYLTSLVVRRLMRVTSANLVNILTGSKSVPEFYQEEAQPGPMAAALSGLLSDGPDRQAQVSAEARAMALIGRGAEPPSDRAADAVLRVLADRCDPRAGGST